MKTLRIIVIVAVCIFSFVNMLLPVSAACSYIRGDSDGDGDVSILDATAIQRKLAELPVQSFNEESADVDGDGVNIIDATLIQRYLAGFENIHNIAEVVIVPEPTSPEPASPSPTSSEPYVPLPTLISYELPVV